MMKLTVKETKQKRERRGIFKYLKKGVLVGWVKALLSELEDSSSSPTRCSTRPRDPTSLPDSR